MYGACMHNYIFLRILHKIFCASGIFSRIYVDAIIISAASITVPRDSCRLQILPVVAISSLYLVSGCACNTGASRIPSAFPSDTHGLLVGLRASASPAPFTRPTRGPPCAGRGHRVTGGCAIEPGPTLPRRPNKHL